MHVTCVVVASFQDSEGVPTSAGTNWRSPRDMQYMLQGHYCTHNTNTVQVKEVA